MIASSTTPDFWKAYAALSPAKREATRKAYRLWRANPQHPSLHFKKVGMLWSVRIDGDHRALGLKEEDVLYWFWVGDHDKYERLIGQS